MTLTPAMRKVYATIALGLAGSIAFVLFMIAVTRDARSADCPGMRMTNDGRVICMAGAVRQKTAKVRSSRKAKKAVRLDANATKLVTAITAAGDIRVARGFAAKIVPFINDLVRITGETPRIKCFSTSNTHVPGSMHFSGRACDFAQHGWGKTSFKIMYAVYGLAKQYGLRDGCEFGDWGHIDDGPHLTAKRIGNKCRNSPLITYSGLQRRRLNASSL